MKRYLFFLVLAVSIVALFPTAACHAEESETMYQHPFLLADSERLEKLSAVGGEEPWKSMKEEALKLAEETKIRRAVQSDSIVVSTMYQVISYNAVGYILDSENAAVYKDRILDAIAYFDKSNPGTVFGSIYAKDGDNWNGSVPHGNTFVTAVAALDIIYPSLTEAEIAAAEAALQCVADAFWAHDEVHYANTWGVRGIWAAYTQDWETLQQCWEEWQYQWHDSFNSDGGQLASSEYALQRYTESERNGKILLPYVMDYMGLDKTFFADEKNKNAFEFLLGYTYTPNGKFWMFGDTTTNGKADPKVNQGAYAAAKYSDKAAGYGAFLVEGNNGPGTLLKLLFGADDGSMAEATPPPSRIYDKTGAFFYENYADKNSLAGAMYNQTKVARVNGHSHTETNAIGLCAYGNRLTGGSGYALFQQPCEGFTWKYIQTSAVSANTVLINYDPVNIKDPSDYNDHNNQWKYPNDDSYGKGIVNGFTNDLLCYAKGDSGNAIPNGTHNRSFVMVASQDYVPGYFIAFDEIQTQSPGDEATVVQRPYSSDYEILRENTEYEWNISDGEKEVKLSVFLVNEPDKIEFWDGVAAGTADIIHLKSMFAKYAAGEDSNIRVATILFPSDENHKKADMKRIETAGASGAKVALGNGITDYVFSSKGGECTYYITEKETTDYGNYDKLTFEAKNVILRKNNGINAMYFAEDGKKILCGDEGFQASEPVSVFMKDGKGTVEAARETAITFMAYGVTGARINGEDTACVGADGKISITVPSGVSEIELICDTQEAVTQMLNGKIANECFETMAVLEPEHGRMLYDGKLQQADVWEENGTAYVSAQTAEALLGGDYTAAVPLRLAAQAKGYTVKWHEAGLIFLSPPGEPFDFEADAPNLGLALRIFDAAEKTDCVSNNTPTFRVWVNGTLLEDFDPTLYHHTVTVWGETFEIGTDCDLPTETAELADGSKRVTVWQGKQRFDYTFVPNRLDEDAVMVTASAEPQKENNKENVLDGDLNTRWSAEGNQWICFAFAEQKTVSAMRLAWGMGDQRSAVFSVEVSKDGKTWDKVFDGESTGTTLQPEQVKTGTFSAKYVRVNCYGTSIGKWNSLTETEFDFVQ